MKYNFDEIVNRKGTGSIKWDFGERIIEGGLTDRFDEDTLPLFAADMDIACAPKIIEAMHKTADARIYGYSSPKPEYYESIISWFKKIHDWDILKEEIVYCPGTVHAIGIAIRAFSKEGEGIIIQRPVYAPFTNQIKNNNRLVVNNQLKLDYNGYYSIDMDDFALLAKKKENTMFILCNPHNPTGRIFSIEKLNQMALICYENNVTIIADEIHGDLIRQDKRFTPIVKTTDKTDHIITCTAINKTFNVAGLHASNIVISNEKLRKKFKKVLGMAMPTPFTINALIAAYDDCEDWLDQIKSYFDGTIDWVMDFLRSNMPKVKFTRPEGTYIFWMDFREYNLTSEEIRKRIYMNANVVLEPGQMFDPDNGHGFERICLSSPRSIVKEAFIRIAKAFEDIN